MNYYNEFDPFAAAWLREIISAKLIPRGLVDDRSITEVKAEDLEGFTQCHFFAGIGGWPLALQLAGVSHTTPLWTGSPPCQPFSVAGKQLGQLDDRHLAPTFMRLVDQCRPPVLFGEQVAAAIGKHWLDDLFAELERQGYACGAAVLPAASVGAPHKRDRLFFGAVGNSTHIRINGSGNAGAGRWDEYSDNGGAGRVADALCEQWDGGGDLGTGRRIESSNSCVHGCVANSGNSALQSSESRPIERGLPAGSERNETVRTDTHHGFWASVDWLGCRDGKFRPVEPGTFPLASGISARVGRLRGYGNAIVPQAAGEFIRAFMGAASDAAKG